MIYHTQVKPELKRSKLLRGSVIAGVGALILLIGGAAVPPSQLHVWGWLIALVSFGLIAIGMIPYRRLCRLEERPAKLVINDVNELIYIHNDLKKITIPYEIIEKMEYFEDGNIYGIGVWIKKDAAKKIRVHDPLFDYQRRQKQAKKRFGCDLFLPFFSKRTLGDLNFESTLYEFR